MLPSTGLVPDKWEKYDPKKVSSHMVMKASSVVFRVRFTGADPMQTEPVSPVLKKGDRKRGVSSVGRASSARANKRSPRREPTHNRAGTSARPLGMVSPS